MLKTRFSQWLFVWRGNHTW